MVSDKLLTPPDDLHQVADEWWQALFWLILNDRTATTTGLVGAAGGCYHGLVRTGSDLVWIKDNIYIKKQQINTLSSSNL